MLCYDTTLFNVLHINIANSLVLFAFHRPDTASFIQKVEREREARDRGEVKDNRGFLAKYWIYIVPVAILLLLSGASPDGNASGGAAARS